MRESLTRGRGVMASATVASLGVFSLGATLLTPDEAGPASTSGPVPIPGLLVVIVAVVSGAAFAALGRQPTRRGFATSLRAAVVLFPGTWGYTSRWVYENLHTIENIDLGRLLRVEYAFDIALIAAATAMALGLITKPRDKRHP